MKKILLLFVFTVLSCKSIKTDCNNIGSIVAMPEFIKHFNLTCKDTVVIYAADNELICQSFRLLNSKTILFKKADFKIEINNRPEVENPKLTVTKTENDYYFFITGINSSFVATVNKNGKPAVKSYGAF